MRLLFLGSTIIWVRVSRVDHTYGKGLVIDFNKEYTRIANVLNYSAAVIPVTKADKGVDIVDKTYQPINHLDRKNWEACEYL